MLKLVLTISNRQTVLEGVFSHRKAILSENMLFVSIVSKRISKDILVSKKLEPHFITITPSTIAFVRATHDARILAHDRREEDQTEKEKISNQSGIIIAEKKSSESKERLDYKNLFDIGQRVIECVSNAEK